MKVQESPPDQERLDLIQAVIGDAAALLNNLKGDSSQAIMQKVNDAVVDLVFENPHLVLLQRSSSLLVTAICNLQSGPISLKKKAFNRRINSCRPISTSI